MSCRRAGKRIPLHAGGELSRRKALRLERHLEGCSDCRGKAEEFRAVLAGLRTAAQRDEHDWPEAEWKRLMTHIRMQTPPRRTFPLGLSPRPAWTYGAAALFFLALSAIILKPRLFRPAPVQPTEILAATELQSGRSLSFGENQFPRIGQDFPFRVREERPQAVEPETLIAGSPRIKETQDILSVTLVSRETGLKVHWTFNRNFEWKEEAKR